MSQKHNHNHNDTDPRRRSVLRLAGAAAIAAPALILDRQAWSAPRKLTFAWNQNAFCLTPIVVAQEKGFFEKNGLKAEIIRINSEPTTYQALLSGDIDATSGAPTGLVQSNIQGVPVVSLGSWDNLVSYTMTTREKINDLAQLKGKKIGINRLGGKSSLILQVMLEDAGLNTS